MSFCPPTPKKSYPQRSLYVLDTSRHPPKLDYGSTIQ